jgi:hypothetical protein
MDVRKTLTDTGYIAVGLGVLGYQQSRVRATDFRHRIERGSDCVTGRARELAARVSSSPAALSAKAGVARDRAETGARQALDRAAGLGGELGKRVEPIVEQAKDTFVDLPDQVARAVEPVTGRVRGIVSRAA